MEEVRKTSRVLLVHWNDKCKTNIDRTYYTNSTNQDLFKQSVSTLESNNLNKLTLFNIRICYWCMAEYFDFASLNALIAIEDSPTVVMLEIL